MEASNRFARTKVIACATVIEEMLPLLPAEMTYDILDFGLHLNPGNLRDTLQTTIDTASAEADTILLGYGLCSMAVVGLKATNCTLVVPRVDDCIAIFLGSRAAYQAQSSQEPGTYYLTKGWIEVSDTYCKGCELCISACPQEVMELDMTHLTPKGYHPAHTFKDGCTGCAICAVVCPDAAITVYREITKVGTGLAPVQSG